jgi:alpha-L-fucosidase
MKYVRDHGEASRRFCMFGSKHTDYDIVDATPYKKDPMKELAEAGSRRGDDFLLLLLGCRTGITADFPAKYSQRATIASRRHDHRARLSRQPKEDADPEKYVAYLKGQVRELLTNYGPIGILWFDGGGAFGKDTIRQWRE